MRRFIKNMLFTLCLVIMALLLIPTAALICSVKLLSPDRLTPIVERLANKELNATVRIAKVELSFKPAFPVLKLQIDSMSVLSRSFDSLSAESRASLPVWSDSLLSFDSFYGSVDIGALLSRGEIALKDVELVRPALNIVLDADGRGNFDIVKPSQQDTTASASTATVIPPLSISHFAFVEPQEIRYFNAADNTTATIILLKNVRLEAGQPAYSLKIDGNISSPLAKSAINIEDISFGLDGRLKWTPAQPAALAVEEMKIYGAFISASLDAEVKLDSTLTIEKARLALNPVKIEDALTVLPDSLRRANRLVAPYFTTDGAIGLTAELDRAFTPVSDSIPTAHATITMKDCSLRYGRAELRQLGFDIEAAVKGPDLNAATVDILRLEAAGPATHLRISGSATNLLADPDFKGTVVGDIELRKLPPIVANLARGFIKGRLDADMEVKGRASMFSAENFHKLYARGRLTGTNLYYLSNDTAKMAEIDKATIIFGTQHTRRDSTGTKSAPMLAAAISVDTATILVDGVDINLGGLKLAAGVENMASHTDTTLVVPVGGGIRLNNLSIVSITDSAGASMRDLAGHVGLKRFKGMARVPEITARLNIGRVAAGAPSTRLVIRKAVLDANMHKLPDRFASRRKAFKALYDSLRTTHPDISPDSVMQLAIAKRRHRPGQPTHHRVHEGLSQADAEIIDWGLSRGFRRFLFGWQLNGSLTTRHARLATPYFPLRNRISRLDITFSNDSVNLRNVRYRAGHSDISMTGLISNIKRGLTSKRAGNALKINFDLKSDTIDVNELAAAAFAGSAYAERIRKGASHVAISDDEDTFDRQLDAMASQNHDTVGPLLIPTNLDGQLRLVADKVLYADMALDSLSGDIMLYDGGVNLHRLHAGSDAGNLMLSALYSAPKASDMHFGFGLDLSKFNIERFLRLVPPVDSMLPIMRDFSGIINAEIAATVDIDSTMNLKLPTLDAAIRLTGDSLAFINAKTYATLGKWLRFRDRADNKIKHMNVEMIVRDNMLQIFPFSFDIDRYRLGVVGYNDLDLNFDYHIAVLRSPIPFKFGVTVKGNPDKFKVRLGGAKFKEGEVAKSVNVVDTARVNLLREIEGVFRRGVTNSRFAPLKIDAPDVVGQLAAPDPKLSAADSTALGLTPAP